MKKYTVFHCGLGNRGQRYIKPYIDSGRFEIIGVCDLDTAKLDACAKEHSLSRDLFSTDLDAMLARRPDIFSFVTGPSIRLAFIEKAAKVGVKGIIFEKPAANTLTELRKIRSICDVNGIKAIVCHQHKYAAQYRKIKEYLDSGHAGAIYEINVVCAIPRNITQIVTHGMDILFWLNGYVNADRVAAHVSGTDDIEGPFPGAGYIVGRIKFKNGVYSFFESGSDSPTYRSADAKAEITVSVLGEKGSCFANGNGVWKISDNKDGIREGTEQPVPKVMHYDLQIPFNADFAAWMDGEAVHTSSIANALKEQEILEAMYKSAETMTRVTLPLSADDPGDRALRLKEIIAYSMLRSTI